MENNEKKTAKQKLQESWNENPQAMILLGIGVTVAAAKLINAVAVMRNSRSWSREVKRRNKKRENDARFGYHRR